MSKHTESSAKPTARRSDMGLTAHLLLRYAEALRQELNFDQRHHYTHCARVLAEKLIGAGA